MFYILNVRVMYVRVIDLFLLCRQWDEPVGAARVFGASGWNRPLSLPRLDPKFDVGRAKQEARDRIKETQRKVRGILSWVLFAVAHEPDRICSCKPSSCI